jgi:uncharacterized RDD family membrane protein YckC
VFCPRCRTENGDAAIRCAGCGTPIALGDEVQGAPLDVPLSLDRRVERRERSTASWESLRPVPLDWEMAPPVEPTPAARRVPSHPPPRPRPRPAPTPVPDFEVDLDVGPVEVRRTRAPAWRRASSWLVDGALLAGLLSLLLVPSVGPSIGAAGLAQARDLLVIVLLVVALVAFAYQWLGVALMGATPGLRVAGLRVVGPDGSRPSPGRAAARGLLGVLAAAALGLGLLVALFTRSGRGAHDVLAGTWVVLDGRTGRAS